MSRSLLLVLLAVAGCATTAPAPKHAESDEAAPPPKAAPFELVDLSAGTQTLLGATLRLSGKVNGVSDRDLTWTAKAGDDTIGSGKVTIDPGEDGSFTADLPMKLADSLPGLDKYKGSDTIDVVVHAGLSSKLQGDRAVSLRTPQPPLVVIRTVQSERADNAIGVIFYVSIKNPNLFDLQMDEMDYKASVGGKPIGTASLPGAALPASATTDFDLQQMEATPKNVGADFHKLVKQSTIDWILSGDVQIDGVGAPFQLSGQANLSG